MAVINKTIMYQEYMRDKFANTLRIWRSTKELVESEFRGAVGIRSLLPGGEFYYHLPILSAITKGMELEALGRKIILSESAPDHLRTIQGELCEFDGILYLTYSRAKTHMREALKRPSYAVGISVRLLLQQELSPPSYDDIMELLDLYPNHVIEFTAFSTFVGPSRGRNTCVWEVRLY